jgi:exodeoxyribonuclease VII large subunit
MRVIATGSVSVYSRDGSYQLYVNSMNPDGFGALYLAYEQLKAKLFDEGLFDAERKLPIPGCPDRVGVITSPTGAAVRDVINVITRRMPSTEIFLYPALVQGEGAEESLVSALDYFERERSVDVIIIGRGGGSIEDLWAFNGERLARKISSVSIPIISAVGHETDFTIADFVSDLRAPTPSAAAELAVPDVKELIMRVSLSEERCEGALSRLVDVFRERLSLILESNAFRSPETVFLEHRDRVRELEDGVRLALRQSITNLRSRFAVLTGKLGALNPISVLSRGYSLVYKDGATVSSTDCISVGDDITIKMSSGSLSATVNEVN